MDTVMKELDTEVVGEDVKLLENGKDWRVSCLCKLIIWSYVANQKEVWGRLVQVFGRVCKKKKEILK